MKHGLKAAAALASMSLRHRGVAGDVMDALARRRSRDLRRMALTATRTADTRAEKVVSRKFRYLWICNPKVASRSIAAALLSVDPDTEVVFGKTVSNVYAIHPEARNYYNFAFIRHPFGRALSLYAEMRFFRERFEGTHRVLKMKRQRYFNDSFFGLSEVDSFGDYCTWLNTPWGSDTFANGHFLSQHVQIRLEDGRSPDFVGRLENIEEDFERVAAHVGMPAVELPRLNTMLGREVSSRQALTAARAERSTLLTARNEALLRRRYPVDLKLYESISEAARHARP